MEDKPMNVKKDPTLPAGEGMGEAWFTRREWEQGWDAIPDEGIDQAEFFRSYSQHPGRWTNAFTFLARPDLASLAPGRYELEEEDALFASVSEYVTKNEEDALYEAHRKYADIQYLVEGEEKIGVVPLSATTPVGPFDEEKDIIFLRADGDHFRVAAPGRFFIFFPGDAHCPGVKCGENMMVRKIVIKVRLT